jgi:hypothetical protein
MLSLHDNKIRFPDGGTTTGGNFSAATAVELVEMLAIVAAAVATAPVVKNERREEDRLSVFINVKLQK